jgi:DNA-directed RNA polymerase specialized sigma subunit
MTNEPFYPHDVPIVGSPPLASSPGNPDAQTINTQQFANFVNNASTPADRRHQELVDEEREAKLRFDRLSDQMEHLVKELKKVSRARDAIPTVLLRRRTTKRVSAVLGVSMSRVGQMKQRYVKEHNL